MSWTHGDNTLSLDAYIHILIRDDEYLENIISELNQCSREHITCQLCFVFLRCRSWWDSWITHVYNQKVYLPEECYNTMIKEFGEIKQDAPITIKT